MGWVGLDWVGSGHNMLGLVLVVVTGCYINELIMKMVIN